MFNFGGVTTALPPSKLRPFIGKVLGCWPLIGGWENSIISRKRVIHRGRMWNAAMILPERKKLLGKIRFLIHFIIHSLVTMGSSMNLIHLLKRSSNLFY